MGGSAPPSRNAYATESCRRAASFGPAMKVALRSLSGVGRISGCQTARQVRQFSFDSFYALFDPSRGRSRLHGKELCHPARRFVQLVRVDLRREFEGDGAPEVELRYRLR